MIELKASDMVGMKTLYTDPSGKYKLVDFGDINNLEVIVFKSNKAEESSAPSALSKRCLGILTVDGKKQRYEILDDDTMVPRESGKGRPPKEFKDKAEFMEYYQSLKMDVNDENFGDFTAGWYRIPAYHGSISSGLGQIAEFCVRDAMKEGANDAISLRSLINDFKKDIFNHFKE